MGDGTGNTQQVQALKGNILTCLKREKVSLILPIDSADKRVLIEHTVNILLNMFPYKYA